MSSRKGRPSEAQWLQRKEFIRRKYLLEEASLETVVETLGELDFHVTSSQLEYKLKRWEFGRNIDKKTWVVIDHRIEKRKRDGKDSEVIYRGKRLKQATVKKETLRNRDHSALALMKRKRGICPSGLDDPQAGSQLSVCTPPPARLEFE